MDQSEGAEGDTEPWVGAAGPAASPPPGPLLPGLRSHSRYLPENKAGDAALLF